MWKSRPRLGLLLIVALCLLGGVPLLSPVWIMIYAGSLPAPAQQVATELAGTYSGNVIVSAPAPLGALTLVFGVRNNGGALSGEVDPTQTMVFLGGPSFTGTVSAGAAITPTFRIDSETFTRVVSGRSVQRKFTLTGEVLDNGNALQGTYAETITGFTPAPMVVQGTFHLVRPFNSKVILAPQVGAPPTPTPIVPDPDVVPPGDEDGTSIRLPIIKGNAPAGASQESASPESPSQALPEHKLFMPEMTKEE